jgi:hypothetical protein
MRWADEAEVWLQRQFALCGDDDIASAFVPWSWTPVVVVFRSDWRSTQAAYEKIVASAGGEKSALRRGVDDMGVILVAPAVVELSVALIQGM